MKKKTGDSGASFEQEKEKIWNDPQLSRIEKQLAVEQLEKRQRKKTSSKSARRPAKRAFLIMVALVVIVLLVFAVWSILKTARPNEEKTTVLSEIVWPEIRLNEIEFSDEYDKYDRRIYYKDSGFGLTTTLEYDALSDMGEDVTFLYHWIYSIITGDVTTYRLCFTDEFYENHPIQGEFSPQQLYNIRIESTDYSRMYQVEYMILQNDGTFDERLYENASRPFYLTLTGEKNAVHINSLTYPQNIFKK